MLHLLFLNSFLFFSFLPLFSHLSQIIYIYFYFIILFHFFHTHILSFTFYITTYIFLDSYPFYISFYISLISSSHSTLLLMVDSFEECIWFDGKFTNFMRIWAYEQPLCSNYFCYVNINLSLFILELTLLCMLKSHYGILCIKMIRANHFPFFFFFSSRRPLFVISVWALTITHLILSIYLPIFLLFEPQFKEIFGLIVWIYFVYILLLLLSWNKVSQLDQQVLCLN